MAARSRKFRCISFGCIGVLHERDAGFFDMRKTGFCAAKPERTWIKLEILAGNLNFTLLFHFFGSSCMKAGGQGILKKKI